MLERNRDYNFEMILNHKGNITEICKDLDVVSKYSGNLNRHDITEFRKNYIVIVNDIGENHALSTIEEFLYFIYIKYPEIRTLTIYQDDIVKVTYNKKEVRRNNEKNY